MLILGNMQQNHAEGSPCGRKEMIVVSWVRSAAEAGALSESQVEVLLEAFDRSRAQR